MPHLSGQRLRGVAVFIGDADHDIFLFRFHVVCLYVFCLRSICQYTKQEEDANTKGNTT